MKITALAGGVGAAKFLSGLIAVMPPEDLTIIVNTGDDFRWMGLYVCPDLDTIVYSLCGRANSQTGWGVRDDSFRALERLRELGFDTWFCIGDIDLATHLYRTEQLAAGRSLTDVTQSICRQNGLQCRILPMTDSYVPTLVHTGDGTLPFQEYFVRRHCEPLVTGFTYEGIDAAAPAPGVLEALEMADGIILCPSNPFVSIAPILAVPGIRPLLRRIRAAILAISPLISGDALKGPAAAMMKQLGMKASASTVADMYRDFLDAFILDRRDEGLASDIERLGIKVQLEDTVMIGDSAKEALAVSALETLRCAP